MIKSLTKREIALIIIAVIFAIIVIALAIILMKAPGVSSLTENQNSATPSSGQSSTWRPISAKISVPDVNSPKSDIADPNSVVAAAPSGTAKARSFSINISAGRFTPNKIAVNQDDNVSIFFTAQDKNYDVVQPDYGLKQTVSKGESKPIMFQATTAGQFTFYCSSCGGPAKGPVGYLMVVPK